MQSWFADSILRGKQGTVSPLAGRAFTLVELLCVIGIIAALVALLLPSLGRTRRASGQVTCMSNLRQWGAAVVLFANENHGELPRRGQGVQPTMLVDRPADWFNALLGEGAAIVLLNDHQKQVLQVAIEKHAYTLTGAMPFREGKVPAPGLVEYVKGDPLLRRPYILAVANPEKIADAHLFEAQRFAEFLRSEETQQWIAAWPSDKAVREQSFFRIEGVNGFKLAAGVMLHLGGAIDHPLDITPEAWSKLPKVTTKVPGKDGSEAAYSGVLLRELLSSAGAPLGNHQLRGAWVDRTVHVRASDGYQVSFALAELDDEIEAASVVIADQKNGAALPASEGPLRVIVPTDKHPTRWAKNVVAVEVKQPAHADRQTPRDREQEEIEARIWSRTP